MIFKKSGNAKFNVYNCVIFSTHLAGNDLVYILLSVSVSQGVQFHVSFTYGQFFCEEFNEWVDVCEDTVW